MSSSAEQESRVDSQVAKALEAVRDPFLRKIAERFQKEPNQILKLSEILGFTTEEEKNTKALVWLRKHEPERYLDVLQFSEAENKSQEEKEMEIREEKKLFGKIEKLAKRVFRKRFQDNVSIGNGYIACGLLPGSGNIFDDADVTVLLRIPVDSHSGYYQPSNVTPSLVANGEYHDINISVRKPTHLVISKKFGSEYERLMGKRAFIIKKY